ncbi:tRNA-modifying protein YgfZ [Arsukibacterium indicum]|uniref:tRNA-modifying protein YgfZ n=1 Tax=Arsukibacterium indicum TaxID=2848612 RepID=A0ABS6MPC4_9GAMM|nr:tRNA-modifying protein YgfZ [Arsukibacterium indicum]MBV2130657.1 tRNA-modifying protein YgfZ [Arsukibacterium indicum]
MHTSWLTANSYGKLSNQVQGAFIAPLPAFDIISVSGPDSRKYLQSQTTCDIDKLTDDTFLRGAHCDAKGKTWSVFHLLQQHDELLIVAFRDELNASVAQWRKFGVFSKVSFNAADNNFATLGIGGSGAAELVGRLGFNLPGGNGRLSRHNDGAILQLADEHFMLILPKSDAIALLDSDYPLAAPTLWLKQHILQGLCYLEQPLIGEFVPQMLNLQAVDAISFTKGCYLGQETVARMKYLGRNKRASWILQAETDEAPAAGCDIEQQFNDNWRRVGQVINAVNINNQLWLIAVLPNDITPVDSLRLKSDSAPALQLLPLPYHLS